MFRSLWFWITSANPVSRWGKRHVLLKRLLWEPVRIVFLVFFRWWGVYILKIFLKRFFCFSWKALWVQQQIRYQNGENGEHTPQFFNDEFLSFLRSRLSSFRSWLTWQTGYTYILYKEKWLLILVESHPQSSNQIWNLEVVQLSRLFVVEVGYAQMMHMFVAVYYFSFI